MSYRYSHSKKGYGKNYDTHFKNDSFNARVWELEKNILNNILDVFYPSKKIENYLDFACGTGRICSFLEDRANNSFGIDITEEMIKIARDQCKKTKFIVGDITINSLNEPEKYDLITAFRFFLNAEKELRESALSEIGKIISKDGILVFNIHGNKPSFRHIAIIFSKLVGRKTNKNEMSICDVKYMLEKHNFEIIDYYGVNFMPQFFSRFVPRQLWMFLENNLKKNEFLKKFAMDIIFVAKLK